MSKLAANLVNNCLRIRSSDNVSIFFYPHSTAIAEDLATECFRVGADAILVAYTAKFCEAYMRDPPALWALAGAKSRLGLPRARPRPPASVEALRILVSRVGADASRGVRRP